MLVHTIPYWSKRNPTLTVYEGRRVPWARGPTARPNGSSLRNSVRIHPVARPVIKAPPRMMSHVTDTDDESEDSSPNYKRRGGAKPSGKVETKSKGRSYRGPTHKTKLYAVLARGRTPGIYTSFGLT
jgi:hypothetical protein